MRATAVICFILLLALEVNGQSFTIYNYSVPEGLPSSEVYEVYQDRKGFLWFATDNGIVKFDGHEMKTYHTKDGLTDPVVFSFFEDHKDRIWFRTFSGILSYFENDSIKKYKYNNKLGSYAQKGLFNYVIDDKGGLWFTVRTTFGHVDTLGNLEIVDEVKIQGVYYKKIGEHYLMEGSNRGDPYVKRLIIDGKQLPVTGSRSPYLNRVLRNVKWKGKDYFSLNQEVYAYDGQTLTKVVSSVHPVISLSVDKEDQLWVGYMSGGTTRYATDDFSIAWEPDFLKNKSVTKVAQDHEGGLWFSTLENGVFHVPNVLISHYSLPSPSRIKSVASGGDHMWVGKQDGSIFEVNIKTKKATLVTTVETPLVLMFSNNKTLWVSTSSEIKVYDHNLKLKRKYIGLSNDFYEDDYGNVYAVGGFRVRKFDPDGNEVMADTIHHHYRSVLAIDSMIIFSDRLGLHLRDTSLKTRTAPAQFSDVKFPDLLRFNDTTLLLTTLGKGFLLMNYRDQTYKWYNTQNNFLADNIYSSLLNDSILWLGTEKGLVRIPVSSFSNQDMSLKYLSKKSGLISDKIDFLIEADDAVWAFSDEGFSVIPNTFTKFTNTRPLFYIQEIKANKKIISPDSKDIRLGPQQNNIEVAFSFISFNNPNILLRYRLSEKDSWIYTTSKKLLFSSLAPGKYTFALEYSTDNSHWIPATASINFTIVPPWLSKWYIQLLLFFVFLMIAYLYFRYQRSINREKHRYLKIINDHQQKLIQSEVVALERERNRISKELHDRVGTNLTAIKLIVSQLLKSYKEPLASDVEDQFQIAIGELKEIIYGLTPPSLERYGLFTGLKNYIGKLNKSIPIAISLKTFGKEFNNHELNTIVFRVLQELLTNSIKHSFAKHITIHMNAFDDVLNIVYEDDGVGFNYDPLQSGLGLDNIESRIQSVNGTLKFESGNFGISYTIDIPVTINKEIV
ncbi:hypothetical protein KK083_20565 [Fulvivirgaceae bacterium PWU4]|uniref:histidine kinase n=1 Tax=Chryseosolibacter histidini TaxID=2782349 RepID=A0AAP2DQC9_9BACT|nr:sensor histidine kinase [Chryseosolibacter histidini]MBT1699302.1 hypothetical protein [Chryseosolibacter histidini]